MCLVCYTHRFYSTVFKRIQNYLARRGIQVVDRDGFVLNPLPGQAQPPPPPQAQPPPVVVPPVPAFVGTTAPAA